MDSGKFNFPHVFIFLSGIILFCAVLTYIIPSGQYERATRITDGREQTFVVPGSYKQLPKHITFKSVVLGDQVEGKASPTSLVGLLTAIPKGLIKSAELIFFILIIGAVFNIVISSGAVNTVIHTLIRWFRNLPGLLILSIYLFFLLRSTFTGGGIQFLPMIPVFMLISREYGYDRIFGLAMFLIPFLLGWTIALTNPVTLVVAQEIAELPKFSGMGLRLILLVLIGGSGFLFLMWYGRRVKMDPSRSCMPEDTFELTDDLERTHQKVEWKHIWITLMVVVLLPCIFVAVMKMNWFLIELGGGFILIGIATILIAGMSGAEAMESFVKGLQDMITPALVIGFATGIQVIIQEGRIIDTLLHATADALDGLPGIMSAEGMFVFQSLLNFFIPSGPGQVVVSMPLMVPLSDLLGITRQTAVLAFLLGDGLSNMIFPTTGVLMASLSLAGIPYDRWARFIWPLFLITSLIGFLVMGLAATIGY